jgi:hypothetical protein
MPFSFRPISDTFYISANQVDAGVPNDGQHPPMDSVDGIRPPAERPHCANGHFRNAPELFMGIPKPEMEPPTNGHEYEALASSPAVPSLKRSSPEPLWTPAKFVAYGVGHVLNDMCASTWFSYLLVFLRQVASLSPVDSAIVMFAGQIADGVATPLVGVLSDKSKGIPAIGFGRRKTWLAAGALLVVICFYFVFAACAPRWFTPTPSRSALVVYYSVGASLFNFGWAAVQVSHMALVRWR